MSSAFLRLPAMAGDVAGGTINYKRINKLLLYTYHLTISPLLGG